MDTTFITTTTFPPPSEYNPDRPVTPSPSRRTVRSKKWLIASAKVGLPAPFHDQGLRMLVRDDLNREKSSQHEADIKNALFDTVKKLAATIPPNPALEKTKHENQNVNTTSHLDEIHYFLLELSVESEKKFSDFKSQFGVPSYIIHPITEMAKGTPLFRVSSNDANACLRNMKMKDVSKSINVLSNVLTGQSETLPLAQCSDMCQYLTLLLHVALMVADTTRPVLVAFQKDGATEFGMNVLEKREVVLPRYGTFVSVQNALRKGYWDYWLCGVLIHLEPYFSGYQS